ncbi:protein of unknown function (DUF3328) domain containing protein [Hyaloscypha variabilis]
MDSEEYRYSAEWSVGIESKDTHFLLRPSQSESEDSNFSTQTPQNSTISQLLHRFWWLQPLVITILSSIICIQIYRDTTGFHSRCVSSISIHSPLLEAGLGEYKTGYFNGTFLFPSIWRGTPSIELDRAWDASLTVSTKSQNPVAVSDSDLVKMGKDPTKQVRVPPQFKEQFGDGALATTEYAHQLHCLNLLRKFTYFDYYSSKRDDVGFEVTGNILRAHIDHCIEILCQVLMCNADTGLYTYNWIEGRPSPMLDFNVQHKCKDFEAIKKWTMEHSIHRLC